MTNAAPGGPPDIAGPHFDRNPSPAYAWLREHSPAHRMPLPGGAFAWLITRHEDAVPALTDPRLSKCPAHGNPVWRASGMGLPLDHRPSLGQHMVNLDEPDHTRLRRLAQGAFSSRRIDALRPRIQAVTDELLDELADRETADLIGDFAYPLPITIICEILGIATEHRDRIQRWVAVLDASADDAGGDVLAVTDAMDAFVGEQVDAAGARPADSDLLAELVVRERAGELSRDEVTSMAFLLLVGGHETTTALIGCAALELLRDVRLAAAVRDDPTMVAKLVEESLRRDTPVRNATWRFPTEPVVIAGQPMRPGDPILVSLLAANRDPAAFDDPDAIRPGRPTRHLAFGIGRHSCLGAGLARTEAAIAIGTLARRFPDMRLRVADDTLRWWESPIMRGLYELPVTL
ncbi:cytochrome P450 [Nocardia sp. CDC159]|uniref:Cytochrome P450 n=1 Tax=Nocardia pulmonis TaxID=2951408 RepID=A0A9X2E2Z7_9NOCA|nr:MULTISPECIES: cytochrome P450 [Nocardia]MCM6772715.1 cytochrome P450 [Nocardia pulmonis]MCM6785982.1 cytochrome P450 [Nocardia sp. CDC159]